MPNLVADKGIEFAKAYLEKEGYSVTDVSRSFKGKSEHRGYDLLAEKNGQTSKIEVKGCTRMWGIPDQYVNEFDADKHLVADFLYVVYFIGDQAPKLCIIPREAIDPALVIPRTGFRISSRFKNQKTMEKFLIRDVS